MNGFYITRVPIFISGLLFISLLTNGQFNYFWSLRGTEQSYNIMRKTFALGLLRTSQ